MQGYKQYEIAKLMGVSTTTIKSINPQLLINYKLIIMKVYNMLPHNSYHLLYIQTMSGSSLKTKCCFTTYDMVLPFNKKVLIYYLEQHQRSYSQQVKLAKRLLSINKLVPLYIQIK